MEENKTYSIQEFAAAIRKKYNAYNDVDDTELTNAFITKNPVYASLITGLDTKGMAPTLDEPSEPVKKQELGPPFITPGIVSESKISPYWSESGRVKEQPAKPKKEEKDDKFSLPPLGIGAMMANEPAKKYNEEVQRQISEYKPTVVDENLKSAVTQVKKDISIIEQEASKAMAGKEIASPMGGASGEAMFYSQTVKPLAENANIIFAKELANQTERMIKRAESPTHAQAVIRSFTMPIASDFVSMGITESIRKKAISNITTKWENGEDLTKDEEALIKAAAVHMEAQYTLKTSISEEVAEGISATIPFLLWFALTKNPSDAAFKAIAGFTSRYITNPLLLQTLKGGLFIGTKSMLAPVNPEAYSYYYGKRAGSLGLKRDEEGVAQPILNEDGSLNIAHQKGEEPTIALAAKAFAYGAADPVFNSMGQVYNTFGKKVIGKYLLKNPKIAKSIPTAIANLFTGGKTGIEKQIGWHGFASEVVEELQVAAIQQGVVEGNWEYFTNPRDMAVLLLTIAGMQGGMSGINKSVGLYSKGRERYEQADISRKANAADSKMRETFSEPLADKLASIRNADATFMEQTDMLFGMVETGELGKENLKDAIDYLIKTTSYDSMIESKKAENEIQVEETRNTAKKRADELVNMVRHKDGNIQFATIGNGDSQRQVYILSGEASELDAMLVVLDPYTGEKFTIPSSDVNLDNLSITEPQSLKDDVINAAEEEIAASVNAQSEINNLSAQAAGMFTQGTIIEFENTNGTVISYDPEVGVIYKPDGQPRPMVISIEELPSINVISGPTEQSIKSVSDAKIEDAIQATTDKSTDISDSFESKRIEIENKRQNALNNLSPDNLAIMASDYLLTAGQNSILSSDYFLQALMGSFTNASTSINAIRNKYKSQINSKYGNLSDFVNSELYNTVISEVKEAIDNSYTTTDALSIFNEILKSPSGVNPKLGNQLSIKLDNINMTIDQINAKYDAELAALNNNSVSSQSSSNISISKPISKQAPISDTGTPLSNIPADAELGNKVFDKWLYDNATNTLKENEQASIYLSQVNPKKVTKAERDYMLTALFGTPDISLTETQKEIVYDTEGEGRILSGEQDLRPEVKPENIVTERGSEGFAGGRLVEPSQGYAEAGSTTTYQGENYTITESAGDYYTISNTDKTITVSSDKITVDVKDDAVVESIGVSEFLDTPIGTIDVEQLSDESLTDEIFDMARLSNIEVLPDEVLGLAMFVKEQTFDEGSFDKTLRQAISESLSTYDIGKKQGIGNTPYRAIVNNSAFGSGVTSPSGSYNDAVKSKSESAKGNNLWVRHGSSAVNNNRTLLVQFSSRFLYGKQPFQRATLDMYFDTLYRMVPGYDRTVDFWEIPLWISRLSAIDQNSDVYVIRNMDEAISFFKEAGYGKISFSALDVNANYIEKIAKSLPAQKFAIGGYTNFDSLANLDNVKIYTSVEDYAKQYGLSDTHSYNYRHFGGTKVIPRLKMSDGCKYKCKFCSVPKKVKSLPKDVVLSQIDAINNLDARLVYLDDKTFGQADNYTMLPELFERIKEYNPDFEGFIIQTTSRDFADDNMFSDDFIKESGIKYVELGVETYNDDTLTKLNKKHSHAKYTDAATEKIRRTGINLIPNLIVGLSDGKKSDGTFWSEGKTEYENTLAWLNSNKDVISHVNVYNLAIYDGTDLADSVEVQLESDRNENITEKSWQDNKEVHKWALEQFSQFAIDQINNRAIEQQPMMSVESEQISPEDIEVLNTKVLNADEKGIIHLKHFSGKPDLTSLSPSRFGSNSTFTTQRRRMGGVTFYYPHSSPAERGLYGSGYIVDIEASKLYPLEQDPLNIEDKARELAKQWADEYLGGMQIGWDAETFAEFAQPILKDLGYEGLYARHMYSTNSRGPRGIPDTHDGYRVELWVDKPINTELTNNLREYYEIAPPISSLIQNISREIENSIEAVINKASFDGDRGFYYSNSKNIDALISHPDYSKIIPDELKDKYNSLKPVLEFVHPNNSELRTGQWGILTAWNPSNNRLPIDENRKRNEELIADLEQKGYRPEPVNGKYTMPEESVYVKGLTTDDAIELASKYGQESVLIPEGLYYPSTGNVNPSDLNKIDYNSRKSDYYTVFDVNGYKVKASIPIDFNTEIPLSEATRNLEELRKNNNPEPELVLYSIGQKKWDYDTDPVLRVMPNTVAIGFDNYPVALTINDNMSIGSSNTIDGEYYVNIEKPVLNNPKADTITLDLLFKDFDFSSVSELSHILENQIYNSHQWKDISKKYNSIDDVLENEPSLLSDVVIDASDVFNNKMIISFFSDKGFDGAIYKSNGTTPFDAEYKPFYESQIYDQDGVMANININDKIDIKFDSVLSQYILTGKGEKLNTDITNAVSTIAKQERELNGPSLIDKNTPDNIRRMSVIVKEAAKHATSKGDIIGSKKNDILTATEIVKTAFPETINKPSLIDVWKIGMAITSEGNSINLNADMSLRVLSSYIEHNSFPTKGYFGSNTNIALAQFAKLNKLFTEMGESEAISFLKSELPASELRDMGYAIDGSYSDSDIVPASYIIGHKTGIESLPVLFGSDNYGSIDFYHTKFAEMFLGGATYGNSETIIENIKSFRDSASSVSDPSKIIGKDGSIISIPKTKSVNIQNDESLKSLASRIAETYKASNYSDNLKTDYVLAANRLHNSLMNQSLPQSASNVYQKALQLAASELRAEGVNISVQDVSDSIRSITKSMLSDMNVKGVSKSTGTYTDAIRYSPMLSTMGVSQSTIDSAIASVKPDIKVVNTDSSLWGKSALYEFTESIRSEFAQSQDAIKKDIIAVNAILGHAGPVTIVDSSEALLDSAISNNEPMPVVSSIRESLRVGYINGFFSTSTGITYYNTESMVINGRTPISMVLHEQGYHHGIRKLIPNTSELMSFHNRVYNFIKTTYGEGEFARVIVSGYNQYVKSGNASVTEEYMARMAQKANEGRLTDKKELSIWKRFLDEVRMFIFRVTTGIKPIESIAELNKVIDAALETVKGPAKNISINKPLTSLSDVFSEPTSTFDLSDSPLPKNTPNTRIIINDDYSVLMDVSERESEEDTTDYLKMIEQLEENLSKHKEKGKQMVRRDIVEQFIREHRQELKRINPGRISAALNKINKAARTNKSLDASIAYLKKTITEGSATQARKKADAFVSKLTKLKTVKRSNGIVKASLLLQQDVDYKDAIITISQMSDEEADSARNYIEQYIEGEEDIIPDDTIEDIHINNISDAELMLNLIDTYSNLRNRPLNEVEDAINMFNADLKEMKARFRDKRKADRERYNAIVNEVVDDISGGETILNNTKLSDVLSVTDRKSGAASEYQNMAGTIASLTHAIWRGFKAGIPSKGFFNSRLYELYKAVDNGASKKIDMQESMVKEVNRYIDDIFDSHKEFAKLIDKEVEINLELEQYDGENTIYTPRTVKVSMDTALHIWASWNSEGNRRYMDNIDYMSDKHRMSEEAFMELDRMLPESLKDFTTMLTTNYFGKDEYYNAINEIYSRRTGRRLNKVSDYVPVAASSWKNQVPYDVNNLGIYKSIAKERRGGAYDIERNGIYKAAMKYADDVSSFAHLAEPVSDFAYILNSRKVKAATKAFGTYDKSRRIIDLLNKGYNYQAQDGQRVLNWLMNRFVGTKVLMNYNLLPKQLTSIMSMFDPDFGNTLDVLREFAAYSTGTSNKEVSKIAKEIVRNHPDMKYRNITNIESLTNKKKFANINIMMFGDSHRDIALGTLLTAIYNPTAVGDRVAIQWAGIPVAIANYKNGLKEASKLGLNEQESKAYASKKAGDAFSEFVNTTQQSSKMTHRSAFQYGGWRLASAFMNSIMGYSRKITRHARDINRDYQAAYSRLKLSGDTSSVASLKAFSSIPPSKVSALFIYTTVLPVLFTTIGTLGGNFARMWSDDDEEREMARWEMLFDSTLGWTKGLYGIGFFFNYVFSSGLGKIYNKKADNIIPLVDDSTELIDQFWKSIKLISKYNDESIKNRPEYEQKLYDAVFKTAITGAGITLGAPTTFLSRLYEISTKEEYNDAITKVARLYGLPKQEIERLFSENPIDAIDEDVMPYINGDMLEYMDAMKLKVEASGKTFKRATYARKFLAYELYDINDTQTRLDVNMLLQNISNEKKSKLLLKSYDTYPSFDEFYLNFVDKYSTPLGEYIYDDGDGIKKGKIREGLITSTLKERLINDILIREADNGKSNEELIKLIDSIIAFAGADISQKYMDELIQKQETMK